MLYHLCDFNVHTELAHLFPDLVFFSKQYGTTRLSYRHGINAYATEPNQLAKNY